MGVSAEFQEHLACGLTTLARCWRVQRKDGFVLGFTDHDCSLEFEGSVFQADSGMTALALEQGTGLGVDNTETLGVLSADAICEADIAAGRYDGALVMSWLVNWADITQRMVLFTGHIGEITRGGGQFQAEVRGLSDALNRPIGFTFQTSGNCSLGDSRCRVDVGQPEFTGAFVVNAVENSASLQVSGEGAFDDGWFTHGVLSHDLSGLSGVIKTDKLLDGDRQVDLWAPFPGEIADGDEIRLTAGCDRQFSTCRFKFSNHLNFRGFPDIPGDEWITSVPRKDGVNGGGSLR